METLVAAVVADVMVRHPKRCGPATTVGQARAWLVDDHVHALLVEHGGLLVAVVERADLAGAADADLAWPRGRLGGRVVGPGDDLARVAREMDERGGRRLAVADAGAGSSGCCAASAPGGASAPTTASGPGQPTTLRAGRAARRPSPSAGRARVR